MPVDRLGCKRDDGERVARDRRPFVLDAQAGHRISSVVLGQTGAAGQIHLQAAPLVALEEGAETPED
jgi:hypothetical protein